jgi:hypothetical protein
MNVKDLTYFYKLKQAMESQSTDTLNISKLESDFLRFSKFLKGKELLVHIPKKYSVEDDEIEHYKDACEKLKKDIDNFPSKIDITGAFKDNNGVDEIIILSANQIYADHVSDRRAYLNPIIGKIYIDGKKMVSDFTIYEALFGKVKCLRGTLDLSEISIFPGNFESGPYHLQVELETPNKTIKKFRELSDLLLEFDKNPKQNLLNLNIVDRTTDLAVKLRQKIGALARYDIPLSQTFQTQTNSCLIKSDDSLQYYLYSLPKDKNVLVYFGQNPFKENNFPSELLVLDGEDHENTLQRLLELDFYEPSKAVLESRISAIKRMYQDACRDEHRSLENEFSSISSLLSKLESVKEDFRAIINPESRRDYLIKKAPQILEFIVYPKISDPLLYELLPKLSWNSNIRNYHDTHAFIQRMNSSDDIAKKGAITSLISSIMFDNQQNNATNLWLYQNEKELCEKLEIKFNVQK